MEIVFALTAIALFTPIAISLLRSLNLLGTEASSYYNFSVIFKNTKPWTIAVYLVIVVVLSFVVLMFAVIPVAKLPA